MKTIKLIATSMLLAASATLTFAGPGPQYWQNRNSPQAATPVTATQSSVNNQSAVKMAANGCHGCGSCKAKS
jgi:hypothetical protein